MLAEFRGNFGDKIPLSEYKLNTAGVGNIKTVELSLIEGFLT